MMRARVAAQGFTIAVLMAGKESAESVREGEGKKIESARLLRDDSVLPSMKSEATTLCSFRVANDIYTFLSYRCFLQLKF